MQKINFLLFLGSLTLNAMDHEDPLLKGVRIVDSSVKLKETNLDQIEGIQFDGVAGDEDLLKELKPFLSDFPLTSNHAETLRSVIATHYQGRDDLRFAVSLPEQNRSAGVIQVVVAPEKLGQLNVKDNKYTDPETLTRWVRLGTAEPINEKTLAQDVGWMNTNPYRSVKLSYQNTLQPGITDVDLIVSDKKSWKIGAGVDNTGTNPIGTTRIFTNLNINNLFFTDHTLKIQGTVADHFKDFQAYTAEYVAPLPWRNTIRLSGSYSATSPNREPYPQKHKESFQASLRYAIPQWFGSNLWIDQINYELGADFKGTNTNVFFEDDAAPVDRKLAFVSQLTAGINGLRKRDQSKISMGVDIVGSPARILPHQTDADFNNLRTNATPYYFYSKLTFAYEQKVFEGWNLFFQGRGQFAFANLIPSEQFSLGGYNTVRGYDEKVVGGDHSVCANFEVRAPEWNWLAREKIGFLGFVDGGYAWFREASSGTPISQGLLSFGPAMRYTGTYLTSRVDVGFPLLKVAKDSEKPHVHFNAIWSY